MNCRKLLLSLLVLLPFCACHAQPVSNVSQGPALRTGADSIVNNYYVQGECFGATVPLTLVGDIAVVANQTSIVGNTHLVDTLLSEGVHITKIFCPEHGFRGTAAAGAHIDNSVDPKTGLPIISLYGKNKKPTPEQMKGIDVVIFDLQDVGCRFYTYLSTLHYVMEACVEADIPLIVLDRPNPNGHYVDGPVLDTATCRSFVGMHPVPVVYGMTIGEYAQMINGEGWLKPTPNPSQGGDGKSGCNPSQGGDGKSGCNPSQGGDGKSDCGSHPLLGEDAFSSSSRPLLGGVPEGRGGSQCRLTVVPMQGYKRDSVGYELPVPPSPNLRNAHAIALYPSLCLFEGTNCGVGRGTDWPFEIVTYKKDTLDLRQEVCGSLGSTSVAEPAPAAFSLKYLKAMYKRVPKKKFFLKNNFFDKLAGNKELRKQIEKGWSEEKIRATWQPALDEFLKIRQKYLIYE